MHYKVFLDGELMATRCKYFSRELLKQVQRFVESGKGLLK